MTVITQVVNPADDSVALKAKGIIKRVIIKRINEDGSPKITPIKNGPNAGNNMKSTHRYAIVLTLDGVDEIIGFGDGEVKNMNYEDQFQIKVEEKYRNLVPGQEISIYPVVARSYEKDGETKVSYNGKRKDIKLLTEAPEGASTPQASAPANSGGKSTKVYGEIKDIILGAAIIHDQKIGKEDIKVQLSEEQLAEIVVGGRLTAYITDDGVITSGFKSYAPLDQVKSSGNNTFTRKSNYDAVGVATGHAINGLGNLLERGFKGDEMETAKLIHTITDQLKKAEAARSGKSTDDVGATVGNAVLNACRRVDVKSKDLESAITQQAEIVLQTLSTPLYDFIGALGKTEAEKPKEKALDGQKPEAQESTPPVQETPPVEAYGYDEPPMDFDDDIPF